MERLLREFVRQRAQGACEYCFMPAAYDDAPFEIDHIVAQKHRGQTEPENLALACFPCNNHKGPNLSGIDPMTGTTVILFHPRQHRWQEHFRYDGAALRGLTPIGRATIEVLEINRPHRVSHRQALIEEGVFPPGPAQIV
jgi:hypothetical protein